MLRWLRRHPTQSLFNEDENGYESEYHSWLADPSAFVEATIEQNERSKRLYELLNELPDNFRSAIALVDLYGLSYAEVSEILKVPLGTLKSRLARARLLMLNKVKNDFGSYYYGPGNSQIDPETGDRLPDGLHVMNSLVSKEG